MGNIFQHVPPKIRYTNGQKLMKRFSTPFITGEIEIKVIMVYCYAANTMALLRKTNMSNIEKNVE